MPDRRPSLLRRMTTAYSLILLTVLGAFGIVALTGPVPEEKYLALVGIALASLLAAVVGLRLVTGLVVRPLKRLTEHVERLPDEEAGEPVVGDVAELQRLAAAVSKLTAETNRRLEAADRLREVREVALSALQVGVVLIEDGRIVYANDQGRKLLVPAELVPDLRPAALRELVTAVLEGSGMPPIEFSAGDQRNIIRARALQLEEGLLLLTLTDVTEARRVDAVRRDFVAAASHELKTPAAAIQAASETVLEALPDDPDAARAFADRVHEQALRLSRIVADLLDLSRLETQEPLFTPVHLAEVLNDEVERLGEIPLDVSVSIEPVVVMGDRADLALATRNLLDNAVRHTPTGGQVRLRLKSGNESATIEVSDDGAGIPKADLPRIFERFYRVDAARSRHTGGTGLGLAIVKHVAEDHGGRVEVESVLGEGSTFRIVLPTIF